MQDIILLLFVFLIGMAFMPVSYIVREHTSSFNIVFPYNISVYFQHNCFVGACKAFDKE